MSGDSELPGNYGMMDMIASLWWVRRNIEFFNGDPDQVTLMGHSAGGCSVGFLVMSPLTKGNHANLIIFFQTLPISGSVCLFVITFFVFFFNRKLSVI